MASYTTFTHDAIVAVIGVAAAVRQQRFCPV